MMESLEKKIRGVIFDVDGVLLDTMHVWTDAGARYLASLGKEAEPRLGDKLFSMTVDMGAVYLKERYDLPLSPKEIADGINGVMKDFYREEAEFKPGALELLRQLYQLHIPMSVATSTGLAYILSAFDRLDCRRYFDVILSCTELKTSKSEPDIFYQAMEAMGSEAANTWLFEDGLYSIKTAKKAGLKTVGVYDQVSVHEQDEIRALSDIYTLTLEDFVKVHGAEFFGQ